MVYLLGFVFYRSNLRLHSKLSENRIKRNKNVQWRIWRQLQTKYLADSWRFRWHIAYQIKDLWKSFPTISHMHQLESKQRSCDELKIGAQIRRKWFLGAAPQNRAAALWRHHAGKIIFWPSFEAIKPITTNTSLEPTKNII